MVNTCFSLLPVDEFKKLVKVKCRKGSSDALSIKAAISKKQVVKKLILKPMLAILNEKQNK